MQETLENMLFFRSIHEIDFLCRIVLTWSAFFFSSNDEALIASYDGTQDQKGEQSRKQK